MTSKLKLKEGEVFSILVGRLKKSKSEVASDLKISDQTLSKSFSSELLTTNIKRRAAEYLKVAESYFTGWYIPNLSESDFDMLKEPDVKYENRILLDELTAGQVMKYLEEKDIRFEEERIRHYRERERLLAIIENLTKPK